MNTKLKTGVTLCALALGLSSILRPVHAADEDSRLTTGSADGSVAADPAALRQWHEDMRQIATPGDGCFHASYPNYVWEKVACETDQPRTHPVHRHSADGAPEVVGNGNDWVAQAPGLIELAQGYFKISGEKTEKSVGVPLFGDGGILGNGEYSIQLNTNADATTSACDGHSGCTVWQQYVYATDYVKKGTADIFIQYWLLNYGACPKGWITPPPPSGGDCYKNSELTPVPDIPVSDIGNLYFTAEAHSKSDYVALGYDSDMYSHSTSNSSLDMSSVWNQVEINVLGDGGGSEAVFNNGTSITVTLALLDGSAAAPTCVSGEGSTGETNNLNLGACKGTAPTGLGIPEMVFSESN